MPLWKGGFATDQFDPLTAIQMCVEEGKVPDRILASNEDHPGLNRPRSWPKVVRFLGDDTSKAESFDGRKWRTLA